MIEANAGTKPVAEQHAFDIAALERYLVLASMDFVVR
jgi:hypothetical protein